jgi:hypothetical protein
MRRESEFSTTAIVRSALALKSDIREERWVFEDGSVEEVAIRSHLVGG